MKNKKNNIKIYGLSIVVVIMSLTVANALTGHGIKGNTNLNPAVMATGSDSGTSSWPGEGITGSNDIAPLKFRLVSTPGLPTTKEWTENEGKTKCASTSIVHTITCIPLSYDDCVPGTVVITSTVCFTPDKP